MSQSVPVEQPQTDQRVSTRVVSAVAEALGEDPRSLEPLYAAIDPDALDALSGSDHDRTPVRIEFAYAGCDVVVSGDGAVQVTGTDGSTDHR